MAPLSVLPGRLRFEARSLNGNEEGCLLVEETLKPLPGVKEVTASHRTGRVLVVFAEEVMSRNEMETHLHGALEAAARVKEEEGTFPRLRRNTATRGASHGGVGHFIMEMALHAFLPAPLELLLPAAAALRR